MTTQFLILRIQGVLDGSADLGAPQLRALATEYRRVCEIAERKLVHCASLIKAGRDYAALQVAETEPLLLESINELVFPQIEAWRNYCSINSLPCPPPFDSYQIDLVKSLYTREISQTHPLYRDYRRAMRMHDYAAALSIIRTIAKVNSANAEAKAECQKLENRITLQKFEDAKRAMAENRELDAVKIASEIRASASEMLADDPDWTALEGRIARYERENARLRVSHILEELKELEESPDFRKILALGAELDILSSEYSITLPEAGEEFVRAQTRRASALQDEKFMQESRAAACRAIAAEIEHPSPLPAPEALKNLLKLSKEADGSLEDELEKKLSKRISALRAKISAARARKLAAAGAAACAVAAAAFWAQKAYDESSKNSAARSDLASLRETSDTAAALRKLGEFSEKYPEIAKKPEFAGVLEKISEDLSLRKMRSDRMAAAFSEIDKFDFEKAPLQAFDALFERIGELEADAAAFEGAEKMLLSERVSEAKRAASNGLAARKAAISGALKTAFADIEAEMAGFDPFGKDAGESLQKARAAEEAARAVVENPGRVFTATSSDAQKLADASSSIKAASEALASVERAEKALDSARDADSYFEALGEYLRLPYVTGPMAREIEAVMAAQKTVEFNLYGGICPPELARNLPEKFKPYGIDFTGDDAALKIHLYRDAQNAPIYTLGQAEQSAQAWRGGSEVTQRASVINAAGGLNSAVYRINYTDGMRARGSLLSGGELTAESKLAERAARISMEESPLKAIEIAANANAHPGFKVWLEKKLLDAMRSDPGESGLEFSKSLKARIAKIDALSRELTSTSWIFMTPSRVNFIKSELYSSAVPDYLREASTMLAQAAAGVKNPMRLAGRINLRGEKATASETSETLYGLDSDGNFSEISKITPANFSPLFKK